MFIKNNFDAGYVNGTQGKIIGFGAGDLPIVKTEEGKKITVTYADWTIEEENSIVAGISQVPLRLAWAITVHKSQGMNLNSAEIDLSKCFLEGMGYVALSRLRSLKGLKLMGINNLAFCVNKRALTVDKYFKKLVPGIKDYPIGCTEWNSTGMFDPRPNTAWNTAMAVKMVKLFLDEKLDYATYFDLVDHPECPVTQPQVLFPCEFGLFTRPNDGNGKTYPPIPKPVYNAFIFLNELKGGKRLPLKSSNDPVNGIAVAMPDGAIRMVLTSYDEDLERQPYVTNVTIEVKGLPSQVNYRCTRLWAADERYGNSYGKWLELGKTSFADVKANKKIMAASKYGALTPPVLSVKGATVNLSLPLPGPGIRLLELKPDKIRQGERK